MISKFAMDEIETLEEQGLHPSPRDIIRLNALAMKVHAARGKYADNSQYLLPRVAVLKGGKSFREPSIGHEVWLDSIMRFIDTTDFSSILAVNCFALSRSAAELPRLDDLEAVSKLVKDFCAEYKEYTVRQLSTAIEYAKFGADWTDGEEPSKVEKSDEDSPVEEDRESDVTSNEDISVAIGVLLDGVTVLSGLTLAEMREMPRRDVEAAIRKACWVRGKEVGSDDERVAVGAFYATLEEIKNRLIKEKEQVNG